MSTLRIIKYIIILLSSMWYLCEKVNINIEITYFNEKYKDEKHVVINIL